MIYRGDRGGEGLEGVGRVGETQAEEAFSDLEGELSDETEAWFDQGYSLKVWIIGFLLINRVNISLTTN